MLDLALLDKIDLSKRPRGQVAVARFFLGPNYGFLPGVKIRAEGHENIPEAPVIFAMNHTDRFNYWPFQYWLFRNHGRFTATWVKGKYFENAAVSRFLRGCNNIPAPSKGYVITQDFMNTLNRAPTDSEYRSLQKLFEHSKAPDSFDGIPEPLLHTPRSILGYSYDPKQESYGAALRALWGSLQTKFLDINKQCVDRNIDLLVFPQGTRSIRLSRGRIGLAQIALKYPRAIVPVGCSGSDKVYPGSSWVAKRGEITYRFGEPISIEEIESYRHSSQDTFSPSLDQAYRARMQSLVDSVMHKINDLVEAPYRFSSDKKSDGVTGTDRFVGG